MWAQGSHPVTTLEPSLWTQNPQVTEDPQSLEGRTEVAQVEEKGQAGRPQEAGQPAGKLSGASGRLFFFFFFFNINEEGFWMSSLAEAGFDLNFLSFLSASPSLNYKR